MTRHLIFKNYWWLGLLLGFVASVVAYLVGGENRVGLVGATIADTLGFFYFVQQQNPLNNRPNIVRPLT